MQTALHSLGVHAPHTPAVICVAPNGARRTTADHPALPMQAADIAREAAACARAGASVLHLHVRDDEGRHSLDEGRYRAAIDAVQDAVGDGLLIQVTTEAVGRYVPAQQMALVRRLRPDAASIALRELAPSKHELDALATFVEWAHDAGTALQVILYDAAEADRLRGLVDSGRWAGGAPPVLFVLGRYSAGGESDPRDLLPFIGAWASCSPWSVCAFGASEAACVATALGLGGHLRVGFENNLLLPDGTPAAGNADLVDNARQLALRVGRRPATPQEARHAYAARPLGTAASIAAKP